VTASAAGEKHNRRGGQRRRLAGLAQRDRRRIIAASALLAVVIAAAGLTQLLSGSSPHQARTSQPPTAAPAIDRFALARLGLRGRQPRDWHRAAHGDRLELRSADGTMLLVFASPTSGSFVARVQHDAERALLDSYKPAAIVTRRRGRLGAAAASTTEILATQRGHRIRILSIAAASRWRTYTVALFSALPPVDNRLAEAGQILSSVRFAAPAG